MTHVPRLTDRAQLERARARGREDALFLHREAIAEIQDRLSLVNKSFTSVAIVTGHPEPWQRAFRDARIVADTEILDLEPGAHDLVIHALALHWADDPIGQLVQARLALVPDGLFLGVLPGGQTLAELRASLAEAETALSGGLSPRVAPMAEIRDLGDLLMRAGFALPVADSQRLSASYADAFALMHDLRAMGETNALAQRNRRPVSRELFTGAAEIYAQHFPEPEGRIRATFELCYLTGWAPDPSQPQPLRPGSAAQRLADALGTSETSL